MKIYKIDADEINTWDSFHDVFSEMFDFPGYYGRNMDAWNDCMSDRDDMVAIHINSARKLKQDAPAIFEALTECAAFINYRLTEKGAQPVVALSYYV